MSTSKRERTTLMPDDSDEEAQGSSSRARQDYYASQRTSRSDPRPSTSTSHGTSKSKGKRVTYQEPADFGNLDESAIGPPVKESEDDSRRPGLEQNLQDAENEDAPAPRSGNKHGRKASARRSKSFAQEEGELTEVAGPQPVTEGGRDSDALENQKPADEDDDDDEASGDDDSGEAPGSTPVHQQRQPEQYFGEDPEVPKWLTELYTISYLIFFSFIGTLARLGTQWITFYPGAPIVSPVIWANFGGSFVLGFLAEDQRLFRPGYHVDMKGEKNNGSSESSSEHVESIKAAHTKRKKAIPLYIGLAVGFCGSYTSFSSFIRDIFLALSNNLPTPINHPHPGVTAPSPTSTVSRNAGYSLEASLHVIMITIALSLGALIAGAQIATFVEPITPRIHGSFIRNVVDPAAVVLGFGCWLGAVFLAIWPPHEMWRGEVIFALVFAPLGCLLRFYASLKLNGLVSAFPLGTFAVNMFGTAVEGMCFDLQHVGLGIEGGVGGGIIGCQILQGIMDGFCGCLTTISTWMAEINGLKRKHGWAYAFASVLGGLSLMVVIMGSVRWSVGFADPLCDTGYTSKVHG